MEHYLDNSATTAVSEAVAKKVYEIMTENFGNPSSLHSLGIKAESVLEDARETVADSLGVKSDEIYFTSGGTESNNLAILGTVEWLKKRGNRIVTTAIEHSSVFETMKHLEENGFEVIYIKPDESGNIRAEQFEDAVNDRTILVSLMAVNNEVGSVMPVASMAKLTHRLAPNALFHTDAVQAFLHLPLRVSTLEADLISVSSHKVHGPKGAGALYVRKGMSLPPYLYGGGQENGYRSGTEAVPAIVGFGAACAAASLREDCAREEALKQQILSGLAEIPGITVIGAHEAPHIVSFAVAGVRSQGLINCLQDMGVYVSAGSACAKGHRSHVLEAMGTDPALIDGSVRVSLSRFTTQDETDALLAAVRSASERLRGGESKK